MAENFDHSEPEHLSADSTGDLPDDFLDELAHTELDPAQDVVADAVASSDIEHGLGSGEHPTPTHFDESHPAMGTPAGVAGHAARTESRPAADEVRSRPAPAKPKGEIGAAEGRTVLIASLVSLAVGLGFWGYQHYVARPAEPEAKAAPTATPAPEPAPATTSTAFASTDEVHTLKSEVDAVSKQVAGLQERIEAMPKAEPPPDISGLQAKIDDLAKVPELVAPLPGKVQALDQRLAAADKSVESLRNELASIRDQLKKNGEAPPATAAAPTPHGEDVDVAGQAMSQGDQLFKKGKFAEALTLFSKLETSSPDDARVWYYAALARGRSSGQWTGETEKLVLEGVKQEKAGKPEASKIDAVFADLSPDNGRDWLAAYRKRAKP